MGSDQVANMSNILPDVSDISINGPGEEVS